METIARSSYGGESCSCRAEEESQSCADWMTADGVQYCQVASEPRDRGSFWALAGAYPQ
jgi:hypothetical protein